MKTGFVYIMASGKNGTIYTGVTSDLVKRVYEHRGGIDRRNSRNDTAASAWCGSKLMTICRMHGGASYKSRNGTELGRFG